MLSTLTGMTDRPDTPPVFLASVALEPNRWKSRGERIPSLKVSEWSPRAAEAGFAGWELWEDHFFKAGGGERKALADSPLPVRVFNTYLRPGIDADADWERVVEAVRFLGPRVGGVKFNLGKEDVPADRQASAAREWAARLPEGVRMLCECHGGTVLETPSAAAAAFGSWPEDRFAAILHPLGGDPGKADSWFEALGGRIRHLHWQARVPGKGIRPLAEVEARLDVVKMSLRKRGFSGTQTIEFVEGTGKPGETPERSFAAAVADLVTLQALYRG